MVGAVKFSVYLNRHVFVREKDSHLVTVSTDKFVTYNASK